MSRDQPVACGVSPEQEAGWVHLNLRQKYSLAYFAVIAASAALVMLFWREHTRAVAVMALVAAVAGCVVWTVAARRIQRSIGRLRQAADCIGAGDFAQTIACEEGDDLAKLVQAFNGMAGRLGRMAEEEQRLRSQLARSERLAAIGELAAIVAHEVNNPLDGLQNCTRILRREWTKSEQASRLLDLMDSGLYRIEMIVRRLLSFSRDETMNLVPTPLADIVGDAMLFIQPRLDKAGIAAVRRGFERTVFAVADRTHMAQVVINLLLNAVDSTAPGGQITISIVGPDDAEREARLVIEDNGSGIAPEHLPRIFEPFFSTKGPSGGTGLGLAVVKKIVEAHHGRIEVASRLGEGTRFGISLPAARAWPRADEAFGYSTAPSPGEDVVAASHGR